MSDERLEKAREMLEIAKAAKTTSFRFRCKDFTISADFLPPKDELAAVCGFDVSPANEEVLED